MPNGTVILPSTEAACREHGNSDIGDSEEARAHAGGTMGFDLIVNEMLPGRVRRAGQLVWSGGNGWVWLHGDRQPAARFGVLELIG